MLTVRQSRLKSTYSGPASVLSCVHYLGEHPWRSGPPQSSVCCLRPPGLSAPRLWTHTGWPVGSPLTLTQPNHVYQAICSSSSPYGIHRGEFIPSESHWSVKKDQLKMESNPNVNAGSVFRPTFCLRASLRCRSVSSGGVGEQRCFGFSFSAFTLPVYCGERKGGALLKSLSHRQDMRVVVALTVNSRDKVLKGTAVKRQSSGPLPLLVLLNGLQHQLFLKRGNQNWHHWMQTGAALHRFCMHAGSCMKAHVVQAWA